MKKELLIQKFLENDLSHVESEQFNALYQSDVSFKTEIDKLLKVDNGLQNLKTNFTINDITVIDNVYNDLKQKSFISTNLSAHKSNRKKILYLSMTLLLFTIISIISYNLIINYSNLNKNNGLKKESAKSELNLENGTSKNQEIPSQKNNVEPSIKIEKNQNEIAVESSEPSNPGKRNIEQSELNLRINEKDYQRNEDILNQLVSDLSNYNQTGDNLNAANTAKRIALFYIDLKNDYGNGLVYLYKSLDYARKTNNSLFIAEILSETGKAEFNSGNKTKSKELLEECIKIYEIENPRLSEFWKDFLLKNFKPNK